MSESVEIPKTCKAGVVKNEGPNFEIVLEEVPVPEPEPDEVLIKLNVTGLCYSDIHFMVGDLGVPPMSTFGVRSPGHEGAGVIVKVGSAVRNLKVGQRAGLKPIWDTCGSCELCWGGKEVFCNGAVYTGLAKTGSYQEYIVSPAKYTSPIPDGVADEVAGPIMCSAATMYRAINEGNFKSGDWICFPGGGGGVGIQGVQIARALGMRPVVVDSGSSKETLARKMGAEAFVDFKQVENVGEAVTKVCDGVGAHGVIVTAPSAYTTAISLTGARKAATVVCVGLPTAGTLTIGEDPTMVALRGLTIKGSLVGSMNDVHQALEFARRGLLKPICEVWPYEKMPEAVQKLKRAEVAGRIVIDFNK